MRQELRCCSVIYELYHAQCVSDDVHNKHRGAGLVAPQHLNEGARGLWMSAVEMSAVFRGARVQRQVRCDGDVRHFTVSFFKSHKHTHWAAHGKILHRYYELHWKQGGFILIFNLCNSELWNEGDILASVLASAFFLLGQERNQMQPLRIKYASTVRKIIRSYELLINLYANGD